MPQGYITDLNRGINEFRGVTNIEVTKSRMRIVIHLQIPTIFSIYGKSRMYKASVMLGRYNIIYS
jgi:hypothetical protein